MAKKKPSYKPLLDLFGLPSTNHQIKKALVKIGKEIISEPKPQKKCSKQ
jgi:hypothetical protein